MIAHEFTIDLPLSVPVSKGKKFILNLNNYRNTHYRDLAKAKSVYTEEVVERLKQIDTNGPYFRVEIEYFYYHPNKRRVDVMNPVSIVDKFFQDALVKAGIILDDSCEIVQSVSATCSGVDRENPRCQAIVYGVAE